LRALLCFLGLLTAVVYAVIAVFTNTARRTGISTFGDPSTVLEWSCLSLPWNTRRVYRPNVPGGERRPPFIIERTIYFEGQNSPDERIEFLSPPTSVSMADEWFDLATTDSFLD